MKRLVSISFLMLMYMLYIFHISFVPLPYFLRTRLVFGVLGLFLILVFDKYLFVNKSILKVSIALCLLITPVLLTTIINGVYDSWFTQYIILSLIQLSGAYFIMFLSFKYYAGLTFNSVIKFIVYAVFIHNAIALVMFLSPAINTLFSSIQNFDENSTSVMMEVEKFQVRIVGLGIGAFFLGGIVSGYALLLNSYLIRSAPTIKKALVYSLIFFFILITGVFIARTTLVGAVLSLIFIFFPNIKGSLFTKFGFRNAATFLLLTLFMILLSLLSITILYPGFWESTAVQWAFEIFLSYGSGDGFSSKSTEHLQSMYVLPDNMKTWIIGDGLFNFKGSYYKETDAGILRLIYYFGLIGAAMFLYIQYRIFREVYIKERNYLTFGLVSLSLSYIFILNFKGLTDVNFMGFLLLMFTAFRSKNDSLQC